ncbi:MAG: MATE family efflux transporter [Planctomycetota bacterium]|jgi:O-antigen/teichoic acid export membrane protein
MVRLSGEDVFGEYAYALTVVTVVAMFTVHGYDFASLKEIPRLLGKANSSVVRDYMAHSSREPVKLSLLAVVAYWVYSVITVSPYAYTVAIAVLLMVETQFQVLLAHVAALGAPLKAQLIGLLTRPLSLVAFAVFELATGRGNGSVSCLVITATFTVFAIAILRHVRWRITLREPLIDGVARTVDVDRWKSDARRFVWISGASRVLGRVDVLMLGWFVNTTQAGIYLVMADIASKVSFGLDASNKVQAPGYSKDYGNQDRVALRKAFGVATAQGLMVAVPASFVLLLVGRPASVYFLGSAFGDAYPVLVILVGAQMVNVSFGPLGVFASMTGEQKYSASVLTVALLVNIVLNLMLVPAFESVGAAVASLLTVTLWNMLLRMRVSATLRSVGDNTVSVSSVSR